jgi:hypothetical protein
MILTIATHFFSHRDGIVLVASLPPGLWNQFLVHELMTDNYRLPKIPLSLEMLIECSLNVKNELFGIYWSNLLRCTILGRNRYRKPYHTTQVSFLESM